MWGLVILSLVGGACALRPPDADIPPYVQARTAFTHSRLYLQQKVPSEMKDIKDPESRRHSAFAILVAVAANIAKEQAEGPADSLDVLDQQVPRAWENYKAVSQMVNNILAEAHANVRPVTNLIDALCRTTDSIEMCNIQVQERVSNSDNYVKKRARLLVHLGRVAHYITAHERELNDVANSFNVVPYLLQQVDKNSFKDFIKDLEDVYVILRNKREPL